MKLTALPPRQRVLAVILLLTLAATGYVWIRDRHPVEALLVEPADVVTPVTSMLPGHPDVSPQVTPHERDAFPEAKRDIFAVQQKPQDVARPVVVQPPPPPPSAVIVTQAPPLPPPAPTAPPLPFAYLGKLGEEGKYTVFLTLRGKNFAVKTGDTFAQTYRVEEIRPPTMTLTYIPMNIRQTMQIGESN